MKASKLKKHAQNCQLREATSNCKAASLCVFCFLFFSGCASLSSSDWRTRRQAVYATSNQTTLEKAALNDDDQLVRIAAVEKLTDETLLSQISVQDKSSLVRRAAVKKITDQPLLESIAVKDRNMYVRQAAVEKLTNQTVLASVATKDYDQIVRLAAVKNLTDQPVLTEIAINDNEDWDVREAAVEKLSDQILLAQVAVEAGDALFGRFTFAAVNKIDDQSSLAKVAVESPDSAVRRVAVAKLTNQSLLAKIADNDNGQGVGLIAVNNISDSVLLTELAKKEYGNVARIARLKLFLADSIVKAQLGEIKLDVTWAKHSQAYASRFNPDERRGKAGEGITICLSGDCLAKPVEYTVRSEFPHETNSLDFMSAAIDSQALMSYLIADFPPSVLAKLATENKYPDARLAAVQNLTGQTVLANIAEKDESLLVREAAKKKLK